MAASQISFGPRFHPRSAPVTFWVLVSAAVLWLVFFFGMYSSAVETLAVLLSYPAAAPLARPWALLTWPLVNTDALTMLFAGYVFWWAGADTERWWGSRTHAIFLAVLTVATALLLTLAAALAPGLPGLGAVTGLRGPVAMVLTIWCLRYLRASIYLLFIPVSGAVLLAIEVILLWASFGPYYGAFATLGAIGLPALYYFHGEKLHRLFRRPPQKPGRKVDREKKARDKRFEAIMRNSNLRLVEDDEDSRKQG